MDTKDIYRSFAGMVLPDEILDYFDLVYFSEEKTDRVINGHPESIMHIYLRENDWAHPVGGGYRPNGYTEGKDVCDFPNRGRKAVIHVKRRRWMSPDDHNEVLDYGDLLGAKGTKLSRDFADFKKVELDSNPVTFKSVADTYRFDASTLGKVYRDRLSGFPDWEQKPHAADWILIEGNVGTRMGIDETAPSRDDLYTILSNKDGHGRKGSVAAMVRGTRSEDPSAVFARPPSRAGSPLRRSPWTSPTAYAPSWRPRSPTPTSPSTALPRGAARHSRHRRHPHGAQARGDGRGRQAPARVQGESAAQRRGPAEAQGGARGRAETHGRKPGRRNGAYSPPRLANGDTEMELLTRCSHVISKSRNKWTESQKECAAVFFGLHPDMLAAYTLADEQRAIFRNKTLTPLTAAEKLEAWRNKVDRLGFKAMANAADTIKSKLEHVVNYFKERHTNASAESLNSKIKGFRSLLRGVSYMSFFMYRVSTVFG